MNQKYERKINNNIMESNLNFGQALEALKNGEKVARLEWDVEGMYLYLKDSHPDDIIEGNCQGNSGQLLNYIIINLGNNSKNWGKNYSDYEPWTAPHKDLLADDWYSFN